MRDSVGYGPFGAKKENIISKHITYYPQLRATKEQRNKCKTFFLFNSCGLDKTNKQTNKQKSHEGANEMK